jgi:hypothetical protein
MPLRLAAFELLDGFGDPRVPSLAEELNGASGLSLRDRDDPIDRFRLLLVVQALGRRNRLSSEELAGVLAQTQRAPVKQADRWVLEAEGFVDEALRIGNRREELRALARRTLLSLVPRSAFLPAAPASFEADVAWLADQVEPVLAKRRSEAVYAAAVRSIAAFFEVFVARFSPIGSVRVDLRGRVPLCETVLMELARKADDAAVDALASLLRDREQEARAAACIALGATRRIGAAPHLLYVLRDEDPFVRVCAYLALRHLTSQDFFVDWLSGSPRDLEKGFQEWGRWLARHGR